MSQGVNSSMRHNSEHHQDLLAMLALLLLYLALFSGHFYSIDGMVMFQQARSIVIHQSLIFDEPILWGIPISISKYGLGLSILYLPGLVFFSGLGQLVYQPVGDYDFGRIYLDYLYTVAGAPIHLFVTIVTAYIIIRFCRRLGFGSVTSLSSMVLFGIGSPALVYARGDFAQPLLGLCWTAALYTGFVYRQSGSIWAIFGCSVAVGYGILTRPVEGLIGFLAILLLLLPFTKKQEWSVKKIRDWGLVLLGGCAGIAITLVVNHLRYGNWWTTGYEGEGWVSPWVGILGLLISPSRGIIWAYPSVLLAPVGIYFLWKQQHQRLAAVLGGTIGVVFFVMGAWYGWWGAWNWGSRLIVPALPLITILVGAGIQTLQRIYRPWIVSALLLAGLIWALPGVATDMLAGYAGQYSSSSASFQIDSYPPLSAWHYATHLLASSPMDNTALDIFWFRFAKATHGISILGFVVFLISGFGVLLQLIRLVWYAHK
jgi:hypothetical protein